MAASRACFVLLVLVNLQLIASKPFFGVLWCNVLCDDDDDYDQSSSTSTTTSMEDLFWDMLDPCADCPTRRPTTIAPPTPPPFIITPFPNGTMPNPGQWPGWGGWGPWVWGPWSPGPWGPGPWGQATTPPSSAATTSAPAATTAASGATTAAAAAADATTAAGDATTAAPTTAAAK